MRILDPFILLARLAEAYGEPMPRVEISKSLLAKIRSDLHPADYTNFDAQKNTLCGVELVIKS